MKSVLISIRPEWCEKIVNGKKTIEVRKNKPNLETPFKCYVYCTQGIDLWLAGIIGKREPQKLNGKVIGEFVCDYINNYEAEFVDDCCQNSIQKFEIDEEDNDRFYYFETSNEEDNPDDCILCEDACLGFEQIKQYVSNGKEDFFDFYAWHISDFVLYDKPKNITDFKKYHRTCYYSDLGFAIPNCSECKDCNLTRPPQSWCYVDE